MDENIKINNDKKGLKIFHSLMQVELHGIPVKTREETLWELKELEYQGQLRVYRPEGK